MKNIRISIVAILLAVVLTLVYASAGCVSSVEGTEINSGDITAETKKTFLSCSDDILNLVTDNDKLVINYYDAYIWVVFFSEDGYVKNMIYIYKFASPEEAEDMVKPRKAELSKNKTMKITNAKSVDSYVVIELEDSSFDAVKREMLENNFSQLIVL